MTNVLESWRPAPLKRRIGVGELHVWKVDLDPSSALVRRLTDTLHRDERARAARFVLPELRRRFLAGRGILRHLLASYLEDSPAHLGFRFGEHGKPHLVGSARHESLSFNFSHSRELALLAIARDCRVGVDIEWIRTDLEWMELAARFFSAGELAQLERLPRARQVERFFAYWTCKEAWVKAKGGGLSIPLDQFEVQLGEEETPGRILAGDGSEHGTPWRVYQLPPVTSFAGAVAIDRPDSKISLWNWSPEV